MKTINFFTILLFALMFFACTKKSDIKTFDFYNVYVSTDTKKNNENNRLLSGNIIIDENKKIVTFIYNGTKLSMTYRILEKNKPVFLKNYNLLGFQESGFSKCIDAYLLSLVNLKADNYLIDKGTDDNSSMLYFTSIESRGAAILTNGRSFVLFGASLINNK